MDIRKLGSVSLCAVIFVACLFAHVASVKGYMPINSGLQMNGAITVCSVNTRAAAGTPVSYAMSNATVEGNAEDEDSILLDYKSRLMRAEKIAQLGYWEIHLDDDRMVFSNGAKEVLGLNELVLAPENIRELVLPEDRELRDEALDRLISLGEAYDIEFKVKRPSDGQVVYIHSEAEYDAEKNIVSGTLMNITGWEELLSRESRHTNVILIISSILGVLSVVWITALARLLYKGKKNREVLEQREKQYRELFENSLNAITLNELMHDDMGKPSDFVILEANKAFEKHTGIKTDEVNGKKIAEFYPDIGKTELGLVIEKVVRTGDPYYLDFYFKPLNKHFSISAYHMGDNQFAMAFMDITQRKVFEEKLKFMSYHDKLTNLYNRFYIEEIIQEIKEDMLPLGIVMLDINGLKIINDTLGHSEGDVTIRNVGKLLRRLSHREDIVARWGGDEFMILLPKTTRERMKRYSDRLGDIGRKNRHGIVSVSLSQGSAIIEDMEQNADEVLKQAEDSMFQHKMNESSSNRNVLVVSLQRTLHEKSHETEQHANRMRALAIKMGEKIGLAADELGEVALLALLHDIGKVGISETILNKPGPLTPEEREVVNKHPRIGSHIVSASPDLGIVSEGILSHHERWDGKGYPRGLKGDEIPLSARVVSIVDAFEVMTSGRPYKKAISVEEALEEIKRNSGTQFDPGLVDPFVEVIREINGDASSF